jgi:hypothetical protein
VLLLEDCDLRTEPIWPSRSTWILDKSTSIRLLSLHRVWLWDCSTIDCPFSVESLNVWITMCIVPHLPCILMWTSCIAGTPAFPTDHSSGSQVLAQSLREERTLAVSVSRLLRAFLLIKVSQLHLWRRNDQMLHQRILARWRNSERWLPFHRC